MFDVNGKRGWHGIKRKERDVKLIHKVTKKFLPFTADFLYASLKDLRPEKN